VSWKHNTTETGGILDAARRLLMAGRREEARALVEDRAELILRSSGAAAEAGAAALIVGLPALARRCFSKLLPQDPQAAAVGLAQAELSLGEKGQAIGWARKAFGGGGLTSASVATIATVLMRCELAGEAVSLITPLLAQRPDTPPLLFNLAVGQRMLGELEAARDAIEHLLRLRPDDAEALYFRSNLRTATTRDNAVDTLSRALAALAPGAARAAPLHFALAKELEDLGDDQPAFSHYTMGNQSKRASFAYDVADDIRVLKALVAQPLAARPLQGTVPQDQGRDAIFVVGLPRSGTTLIQQSLLGVGRLSLASELDAFPQSLMRTARAAGFAGSKTEFVAAAPSLPMGALGENYMSEARAFFGQPGRFIDKLPLNYLYLGLIHLSLPAARIIFVERDLADCAMALFRTLFGGGYPFAYDWNEIEAYLRSWAQLKRHWQEQMGDRICTVSYEEFVAAPAPQISRMRAYCALEGDDLPLSQSTSSGVVATASSVQVRQPIHTRSVGLWRRYESYVPHIVAALAG
jgi:tetratricopeptide (TPR) repeat protein